MSGCGSSVLLQQRIECCRLRAARGQKPDESTRCCPAGGAQLLAAVVRLLTRGGKTCNLRCMVIHRADHDPAHVAPPHAVAHACGSNMRDAMASPR